jgi:hypothetical protein
VLAGPRSEAVLVGEAKLRRVIEAEPLIRALLRKAERIPRRAPNLRVALAAPIAVNGAPEDLLTVTAVDIFGLPGEPAPDYRGAYVLE